MNEYVCKLGEFSGSDYLEFRKGNSGAGRKFLRQDSLYVLDSAFFFFLERIFREIITSFDMFEDTCVTRREWQEIMHLNIPEIVPSEFVDKGVRTKSWTKQRPQGGSRYIVHIRKESPRPAII